MGIDTEYSDEEATRRMNEVVKRMINTPPKPHKPLGKLKPEPNRKPNKERPPSKGRVHKGKTGE